MTALKKAKYDSVVSMIKPIMLKNGVSNLIIKDIASEIEVGEATLYRYFGNKTTMVIEVGVSLWKDIYKELSKIEHKSNGYQSVKAFFEFFLEGYQNNREVFIFLDDFDALMVQEKISRELLNNYDKALMQVKAIYNMFFELGVKDNTIKHTINQDEFYFTTTHMILGICKRLAANGSLLPSDDYVDDVTQIKLAIDICMNYIKNESEKK